MSAREIREIIREYADQGGTVVLSTHNMWEVQKLCSDVAIINKGRIVYSGSRAELEKISGEREFEEIFVKLVRDEHAEAL
jgi:ABC-2 type transport system ATP-binding protein